MGFFGSFPRAPLAQLDRATDYESVGRPFESGGAHHLTQTKHKHYGADDESVRNPRFSAAVCSLLRVDG